MDKNLFNVKTQTTILKALMFLLDRIPIDEYALWDVTEAREYDNILDNCLDKYERKDCDFCDKTFLKGELEKINSHYLCPACKKDLLEE